MSIERTAISGGYPVEAIEVRLGPDMLVSTENQRAIYGTGQNGVLHTIRDKLGAHQTLVICGRTVYIIEGWSRQPPRLVRVDVY